MSFCLSILLSACRTCPTCPQPIIPAPKTIFVTTPACRLPEMPPDIDPKIMFPDAGTVALSREDFGSIAAYVAGMKNWINSAMGCLRAVEDK